MFPLEIFPYGSLASSVITTVWVGVAVVAFFNLRLGWVLSGLVVPGYLVPLILIKPVSAAVILLEGMVTYGLVWLFSERLSGRAWSALFGRDRFFALVLVSVVVRLVFDSWLLPWAGAWLTESWDISFDYRNNLHSFGLVIVALIANQFWKSGLRRGLLPLLTTLAVTLLIVRYGLMELTNFSLSSLSFMYEDLAASILAAPKAYIVLITTAFIASRMNLYYGWDFNGILLPALLALQWYEPVKILASFVEAYLILGLSILLLKLPVFQRMTIEGARKLLLFFNVGFAYKLASGYLLVSWLPGVKVTDYYAFGYLLSTLLALKMHDKGIAVRLTRATLQTSLVAVATASMLGMLLTLLPDWTELAAPSAPRVSVEASTSSLAERLRAEKVRLYQGRLDESELTVLPAEMGAFSEALGLLLDGQPDERLIRQAAGLLNRSGIVLERVELRYLFLRERDDVRGRGLFVIDTQAQNNLAIELPRPLEGRTLAESGVALFLTLGARTLALAGPVRTGATALTEPQSLFHAFHRVAGRDNVLQVRAHTNETRRVLAGLRRDAAQIDAPLVDNELWVTGSLPADLDLVALKQLVGDYRVEWGRLPFANIQRNVSGNGFAELLLERTARRRLLFHPLLALQDIPREEREERIDGYLQDWLLSSRDRIAPRGSDHYRLPELEELLYLDEEVLTPLLALSASDYRDHKWTEEGEAELRAISAALAVMNYQLTVYHHRGSGHDYLLISEEPGQQSRYWGTYVIRLGSARPYIVEAPRPLYEVNSFEMAVSLFERLKARVLLVGGAHPQANRDYSADLIRPDNRVHLFNLVQQVVLREVGPQPMLVVQCRAFGQRPGLPLPEADALLAFASGAIDRQQVPPLGRELIDFLEQDQWRLKYVDGSLQTTGYQVGGSPQARYLRASPNKEFALLWVSPLSRATYRQQQSEDPYFLALGISSSEADLYSEISHRQLGGKRTAVELENMLLRHARQRDVLSLYQAIQRWPQYRFERLVDVNTRQAFLLVSDEQQRLSLVLNLSARLDDRLVVDATQPLERASVVGFAESRKAILRFSPVASGGG